MNKLYFSISELIHSDKAIKHNINNMPDIRSLDCMLDLIFFCLQSAREILGAPMLISSGFRCPQLNKLVGGSVDKYGNPTSQHTKGQAVDFVVKGMSVTRAYLLLKNSNLEFDQLICEYNKWIHLSFVKGKNRRQAFVKN